MTEFRDGKLLREYKRKIEFYMKKQDYSAIGVDKQ